MARLASRRKELRLRRVSRIRRVVVIRLVATNASGRQCRVIVVDVTVNAHTRWRSVHAGQGERSVVVVKHSVRPQHRVVTQFASRRESSRDVVHRGESVVVIRLMAAHAGRSGDVVVAINMATRALQRGHHVRPGQGETGSRVVEDCIGPQHRVMTLLASLREASLHVVRIGRSLVILQMATYTGCRGDAVVAIDVAVRTLQRRHHVRSA